MEDLQFNQVMLLSFPLGRNPHRVGEPLPVESEALRDVAEAFAKNLYRITCMGRLPMRFAEEGTFFQRLWTTACVNATGTPVPDLAGPDMEADHMKIALEFQRLVAGPLPTTLRLGEWAQGWQNHFPLGLRQPGTMTWVGCEMMLSSIIIAGWTAVETLMTDLWIAAVDHGPVELKKKALLAVRNERDDDDAELGQKKPTEANRKRGISADKLTKYGFDLKDRMGYYVWREGPLRFNTLDDLRHAFKAIFAEAKDWCSGSLYVRTATLEAVRHVLAHRGGIVDDLFRERVKDDPALSRYATGQQLEVDGGMACELVESGAEFAADLLKKVDAWLVRNPA